MDFSMRAAPPLQQVNFSVRRDLVFLSALSSLVSLCIYVDVSEIEYILKQQLFILLSNIWFEYKEGEAVAGYVSFSPALCAVINSLTIAMTGKLFKSIRIFL